MTVASEDASAETAPAKTSRFDPITEDLRHLRAQHDCISYSAIAMRIAAARQGRGIPESAARVARSTVYDCFKPGRRRINPDLVAEIVIAMGENAQTADAWRARCVAAQQEERAPRPTPQPPAHPQAVRTERTERTVLKPSGASLATSPTKLVIVLLLATCVGINLLGNSIIMKFNLPVFLDMIGTAIAAITLGPWYGVAVGLSTNLLNTVGGDPISLAFAPVNVVGALIWGYGYHRFGFGRTPLRFFSLNLIAALGCTVVAVPITAFIFGGVVTHWSGDIVQNLSHLGYGLWVSIFSVNLTASIADKLIAGYSALLARRMLAPRLHLP